MTILVHCIVILKKVFAFIVILMTYLWRKNNLFVFPHYNQDLFVLKLLNAFFKNAISSINKDNEKLVITKYLIRNILSILYLHIHFYEKFILKVENCQLSCEVERNQNANINLSSSQPLKMHKNWNQGCYIFPSIFIL